MRIWILHHVALLFGITIYVDGVRRGTFCDLGADCMT